MGLLMYSALTFMESDLKKHAFIQTQRQMESHIHINTVAQPQCGNTCKNVKTHTVRWDMCASFT